MYAPILFENRSSSRFQSNHQRGYFCRTRIIRSGAMKSSPPVPAPAVQSFLPPPNTSPCPTLAATIRIGIMMIHLNAVVSRLSSRSGYATANCTGYSAVGWPASIPRPSPLSPRPPVGGAVPQLRPRHRAHSGAVGVHNVDIWLSADPGRGEHDPLPVRG